ncbi:BF3164 family lipoprotein [Cecembia calidifontis]|uniref:TolB-like protein n=1 Tax=Cecembia calidifontis TaxID=1187080 RepID=A0A4Q7PDG8_9BACT|nr:BF3164 family lipoprotein [Cecembia calidifontis]RZS98411.1 TolB-like protein [Cecembia calidifontis]
MKKTLIYLILVFLIGCDSSLKYKDIDYTFTLNAIPEIKPLKAMRMDLGLLLSPVQIFFYDSLLFVSAANQPFNVKVFDTNKDNELIGEIFENGMGPSETLSVFNLIFLDDGTVWVHDVVSTLMKRFLFDIKGDAILVEEIESLAFMNPILSSVYLRNDQFYTTTQAIVPLSRFLVYSREGDEISGVGNYPDYGIEMPPMVAVDVFSGQLISNPQKDKMVLAYEYTDLIELYDEKANLLKRIHGPHQFVPDFDIGDRSGTPYMKRVFNKTQHAYKSLAASEELIFLLYANGKTVKPGEGEASIHHNKVLAIDWEGNPLAFYELDHAVTSIAVDWEKRIIYGLDRIESEVYAFHF